MDKEKAVEILNELIRQYDATRTSAKLIIERCKNTDCSKLDAEHIIEMFETEQAEKVVFSEYDNYIKAFEIAIISLTQ